MVRFSDLLGGNEPPEERPRPAAPEAIAEAADAADADDDESPEDVLERLTQYATSARVPDPSEPGTAAPEPPAPEPTPATFREVVPDAEPDAPAAFTPVADDLLPRPKGRKGRES